MAVMVELYELFVLITQKLERDGSARERWCWTRFPWSMVISSTR